MKSRATVLTVLLFLLSCLPSQAETFWCWFRHRVDSADVLGADPAFVSLPAEGFLATLNVNEVGSHLRITHNPHSLLGLEQNLVGSLSSHITSLSLGLHYRGWGLIYSRDLVDIGDYKFTYSSYGKSYGLEFTITRSSSLSGTLTNDNASTLPTTTSPSVSLLAAPSYITLDRGSIHQRSVIIQGYYVGNNDRFSLPAAMSHTVIQRRSAGSWLAAVNLHSSHIRVYEDPIEPIVGFNYLSLTQCSLGGGYAYNLVFGQEHCLLHGSLMPMAVFLHRNRYYYGDEGEHSYPGQRFSVNANAHVNFVYNVSRFVTGFNSYFNFDSLRADRGFSIYTTDWMVNMFVGVRF